MCVLTPGDELTNLSNPLISFRYRPQTRHGTQQRSFRYQTFLSSRPLHKSHQAHAALLPSALHWKFIFHQQKVQLLGTSRCLAPGTTCPPAPAAPAATCLPRLLASSRLWHFTYSLLIHLQFFFFHPAIDTSAQSEQQISARSRGNLAALI